MSIHHDILGVPEGASAAQINRAYKKKARTAHPDMGGSDAEMKKLNQARDALLGGGDSAKPRINAEKPDHMSQQFDNVFSTVHGMDNPFTSTGFDESRAPRDDLGGYSYRQHKAEQDADTKSADETYRRNTQEEFARRSGWSPEKAANSKCAVCGDEMDATAPHEAFNSLTFEGERAPHVGMHDECYERAKIFSMDHCEDCGEKLSSAEKQSKAKGDTYYHRGCTEIYNEDA